MIFIFYNQNSDVCVMEFEVQGDTLVMTHREEIINTDINQKVFKEKIGVPTNFIDKVILDIQDRFKEQDVYIFNSETSVNLYERQALVNTLFTYRDKLHIFNIHVTEEDVIGFATWIFSHQ